MLEKSENKNNSQQMPYLLTHIWISPDITQTLNTRKKLYLLGRDIEHDTYQQNNQLMKE
jgi:hypothetical protein